MVGFGQWDTLAKDRAGERDRCLSHWLFPYTVTAGRVHSQPWLTHAGPDSCLYPCTLSGTIILYGETEV